MKFVKQKRDFKKVELLNDDLKEFETIIKKLRNEYQNTTSKDLSIILNKKFTNNYALELTIHDLRAVYVHYMYLFKNEDNKSKSWFIKFKLHSNAVLNYDTIKFKNKNNYPYFQIYKDLNKLTKKELFEIAKFINKNIKDKTKSNKFYLNIINSVK